MSVDYGQVVLYHSVFNCLEDSISIHAQSILKSMQDQTLLTVNIHDVLLLISKRLLETETGQSLQSFVLLLFKPAFTCLIAKNWNFFNLKEKLVWNNVVLCAKTLYEESIINSQISLFDAKTREFFSHSVESMSVKIELICKALEPFDNSSYEQEIGLLLELYDLLVAKDLPREISVRIYDRIMRSQARYAKFNGTELQELAVVASSLVYIQKYPSVVQFPDAVSYLGNVPYEFESILDIKLKKEYQKLLFNVINRHNTFSITLVRKFLKKLTKYVPDITINENYEAFGMADASAVFFNEVFNGNSIRSAN